MKRCPITFEPMPIGHCGIYSPQGLRQLSRNLPELAQLPFNAAEQRQEAAARAGKMSIQGVQPKFSAKLNTRKGRFEIVDHGGQYILKPPSPSYPHLPENENLTMHLAATIGIEVPVQGLVQGSDGTWTYFIKRFDRPKMGPKRGQKLAVEDFAQLSNRSRETKYDSSMEQVVAVVNRFCTFPKVEAVQLFVRTVFFFLTGGEDMHLKNFSLITRPPRIQLAPAYDLLNSTIALRQAQEEFALPLRGKKSHLTRKDLVQYFGQERLGLPEEIIDTELAKVSQASKHWPELIADSFLPEKYQDKYLALLRARLGRLDLD